MSGFANIEARICNKYYGPMFDQIRSGQTNFVFSAIKFKGGFLPPVDWRPREYNSPADNICDWIFERRIDLENLCGRAILDVLGKRHHLQIHRDGGFSVCAGATTLSVHGVESQINAVSRLGYWCLYLATAMSAFHAKIPPRMVLLILFDISRGVCSTNS